MKSRIFIFAVIASVAGMFLVGCGRTSEPSVEASSQQLKDAKADYIAEWNKFKSQSEQQIKANEERIEAFKENLEETDASADTKTKYHKAVAELEQKNRDLGRALDEYRDEGEGKWEVFKSNFSHDLDAVGNTIQDLFKENG
ncbi:MAG: hypothetical protein WAO20_04625 [Acidobacteriota bacterium]